jgi:hypothetical protein
MAGPLITDPRFLLFLGSFYASWTAADMTLDFAIGRFMDLPADTTQMLTAGMQYGNKIRILREVIRKGEHKNKAKLLTALNKMQNESKRNVFAHSYLIGSSGPAEFFDKVSFVERPPGGEYIVREHEFTLEEWKDHCVDFAEASKDFWDALGATNDELQEFGITAVRAAQKSKRRDKSGLGGKA